MQASSRTESSFFIQITCEAPASRKASASPSEWQAERNTTFNEEFLSYSILLISFPLIKLASPFSLSNTIKYSPFI